MQMSYSKLRGKIKEVFVTQEAFATAMGVNAATISAKLNGKTDWTAKEVDLACRLLHIPLSEMHIYFFCPKSCENATA